MTKDWRLEQLEAQPHLRAISFMRKAYQAPRPEWDHDHCAACWTKLTERDMKIVGAIHEGYATTADFVRGADYCWVCVPCFEQFQNIMEWKDATPRTLN